MKVALIGASGFVGSALLNEALERGHQVTALVRNPSKIITKNPNLTVKELDVMVSEDVTKAVKGYDAVISAYNPGWKNPNIAEDTLNGYKSIIEGVKKAGVKRFQMVGGAGSLFVEPGKTIIDMGYIPKSILSGVKALAQVLTDYLRPEKELDWVFFSPAATIEPSKRTGKYRLGKDNLISGDDGESRISVEDYAKAMIDELEKPQHHRERFTIGY